MTHQVENEVFFQPVSESSKEPILFLEGADVELETSIYIFKHHFNFSLLQWPGSLSLGNLNKE